MNAKEALHWMEHESGIMSCNDPAWQIAIRALRLLAAAEANDGGTPETEAFCCEPSPIPAGREVELIPVWIAYSHRLERERNGLAARVGELERDAERYRWLRRHQICYGDDDKGNARVTVDFTVGPWSLSPVSADEAIDAARSK